MRNEINCFFRGFFSVITASTLMLEKNINPSETHYTRIPEYTTRRDIEIIFQSWIFSLSLGPAISWQEMKNPSVTITSSERNATRAGIIGFMIAESIFIGPVGIAHAATNGAFITFMECQIPTFQV